MVLVRADAFDVNASLYPDFGKRSSMFLKPKKMPRAIEINKPQDIKNLQLSNQFVKERALPLKGAKNAI